jgi:hypothetical protein
MVSADPDAVMYPFGKTTDISELLEELLSYSGWERTGLRC